MAEANAASPEQVSALLTRFATLTWPVSQDDVPALIDTLGWSVTSDSGEGDVLANSALPINRPDAQLTCIRGELNSVSVTLTDVLLEPTPWRADFLRDAFADIVTAATQALGSPSKRSRKPSPQVRWDLANGGRVTLTTLSASISAAVDSARYADAMRTLGS